MSDEPDDVYKWLRRGYRLQVKIQVGNQHNAEIRVSMGGKAWGPEKNSLFIEGEPTTPLIGGALSVVSDVQAGTDPPQAPALLSVFLAQFDPETPNSLVNVRQHDVKKDFGAGTASRFDFMINLY